MNSFARHSWVADATLLEIADSNLVEGTVLIAMFWWAWIELGKKHPEKRGSLAANLGVCSLAMVLARIFCFDSSLSREADP